MMRTPDPPGSPGVSGYHPVKPDPEGNPILVVSPDIPPGTIGHAPKKAESKGCLDIPTKIMDKLETDDLESYMHYKDLVERHQCQLPEIAVPEQTTEDSNGQLKIAVRCQVCQKVCSCWNKLQYHLQTHVNLRPYKCNVCEKKFYAASKLHRHKQTHSGNKPHKCPLCDVRVSRQEHLKRHMLVHFEEKPYKCSSCNHGARRVDSIRQHIKSKHPGEDVEWVFIGGDSEMRKEFVAKFLDEHLKKATPGNSDKSGKSGNSKGSGVKLTKDGFIADCQELQSGRKGQNRNSSDTSPMANIVVLSKKKSKRKRKGSNPQQIKNAPPTSPKTPDQLRAYGSPPVKAENVAVGQCPVGQQNISCHSMSAKRERLSPGDGSCSQIPGMARPGSVKGEYHDPYIASQAQSWSHQPSNSSISPGHSLSQPSIQPQFQMSQSQHLMHHDPAALRYTHTGLHGQSSLAQNYLPQNSNWNGQYPPIPQMAASNFYGHGLAPTMVMPNSLGQMMVPLQSMGTPHENQMRNIPDYYKKRMSGDCSQLHKVASRQQSEG